MQKNIGLKLLAGTALAFSASAFAAPSGSPSGSAGLGIDTGLASTIASDVPGVSITHSETPGMGGPMQGVHDVFIKKTKR